MPSLVCPNCKYQTDENEQFCSKCGTKLQSDSEKTYCKSCGAELKLDALFCAHCGVKLNAPEETNCSKCGALLKEKDLFCPKCGTQNEELQSAPSLCKSEEEIELQFQSGMEDYYHHRYFSAARNLKKPAEQGHPKGQYYLAKCLGDKKEAEIWKKRAAENGITDENAWGDPEELLVRAEQGDVRAQYELGNYYVYHELGEIAYISKRWENDRSFRKNVLKWYQRSADKGYAPAQYELSHIYRFLHFVKDEVQSSNLSTRNFEKKMYTIAIELLRSAAEKGHVGAMSSLAGDYERPSFGEIIKKDTSMAFHLYYQAAKESADAEFEVGWCYEKGIGTAKDKVEASTWYQKAAEHGFGYDTQELLKKSRRWDFLLFF